MQAIEDFHKWKEFWKDKVLKAEALGISDQTIARGVDLIQNFLSHTVDPENPQERLLQEMWRLGDAEERKALSNLVLKLVKAEDFEKEVNTDAKKH